MNDVALELSGVSKSFNGLKAVNNVSLSVKSGGVFGLIGPNGSGKTTIIRMALGMFEPDNGTIKIMGQKWDGNVSDRVGYLPEERGLYQDLSVNDVIIYLASLKGIGKSESIKRASELLRRFDLSIDTSKKVKELSHGMAQFVQLAVSIIHNPDLVILDEPFAGLDPLNCKLFGQVIDELKLAGKAVLMSTHRMEEIEALCQEVFMINKGQCVLCGDLGGIKEKYKKGVVRVVADREFGDLEGISKQQNQDGSVDLWLADGVTPEDVLRQLLNRKLKIKEFVIKIPTLQEIFVDVVGSGKNNAQD